MAEESAWREARKMTRLIIVVEGQTEETFVNDILGLDLLKYDIQASARLIGKPGHKGGVLDYKRAKWDITALVKQDWNWYCTTMFDFFRLPNTFPGMPIPERTSTLNKATLLENALFEDIKGSIDDKLRPDRFIPYIQMHEFEGLLFSDPKAFVNGIYNPDLLSKIEKIRNQFDTPEDINSGSQTAPSKRILALFPGYEKPIHGSLGACQIGLEKICAECKHFNDWITKLRKLG
jgi:hypothetical protein